MPQIVLDSTVLNRLHNLTQSVELCDDTGRVVGRFIPRIDMSEWEAVSPAASEEELDRREQAGEKRYTTAEVLARLEKL